MRFWPYWQFLIAQVTDNQLFASAFWCFFHYKKGFISSFCFIQLHICKLYKADWKEVHENFSNQSTLFYFFGIWKLYQATASVRFKQYILCVESVDNNFGFYGFSAGGARHVNKMIRGAELIEFSFWLWGSQKSHSSQLCAFWRRG